MNGGSRSANEPRHVPSRAEEFRGAEQKKTEVTKENVKMSRERNWNAIVYTEERESAYATYRDDSKWNAYAEAYTEDRYTEEYATAFRLPYNVMNAYAEYLQTAM